VQQQNITTHKDVEHCKNSLRQNFYFNAALCLLWKCMCNI